MTVGPTEKRVLYLVHGLPPNEYSGTPLVADGYARHVESFGWHAYVMYVDSDVPTWVNAHPSREIDEPFDRIAVPPTGFANWTIDAASSPPDLVAEACTHFERLLREVSPDLLHVLDNVNMPLELPEIASHLGIPVVRTVSCAEDLCGLIAPVSSVSDPEGYCRAPITPERCARCVSTEFTHLWGWPVTGRQTPHGRAPETSDIAADEQRHLVAERVATSLLQGRSRRLVERLERKRQRAKAQYGSTFDRIIFSTDAFREYFSQTLPLDSSRVHVVPMGMEVGSWPKPPERNIRIPDDPLVFCLAGMFDRVKGQTTVVEAFTRPELAGRRDYRLHLLGSGDPPEVSQLIEANGNVSALGPYAYDELPGLLAAAHVGLSTSRFETFHRVTREYLLAGLPVVANPTFGIQDVLREGENAVFYDHAEPESLTRAIVDLLEDKELYRTLAEGAGATEIRSVEEETKELVGIYDELLEGSHKQLSDETPVSGGSGAL